jgi:hypothetical protein
MEFNIYDDLDTELTHMKHEHVHTTIEQQSKQIDELTAQLKMKDQKISTLLTQTGILGKNLSILFRTAQAEIKKKNKQIETLREQLNEHGQTQNK